jgi:hypothetical protein
MNENPNVYGDTDSFDYTSANAKSHAITVWQKKVA